MPSINIGSCTVWIEPDKFASDGSVLRYLVSVYRGQERLGYDIALTWDHAIIVAEAIINKERKSE